MCYYSDDIIKIEDIIFGILLDENSNKNILFYDILYKTFISAKSLHNYIQ